MQGQPTKIAHALANMPNSIMKPVGIQPDLSPLHSILRVTEAAKFGENATAEQTLQEARTQVRPHRKDVRLHRCTIDESVLRFLAEQKQLEVVDFMYCDIENSQLGLLSGLPKLRHITFLNSNFGDEGAQKILGCQHLNHLKAGGTLITDAGLRTLVKLEKLVNINVERCPIVTIDGIKALCKSSSLTKIDFSGCPKISAEDAQEIRKFCKDKRLVSEFLVAD